MARGWVGEWFIGRWAVQPSGRNANITRQAVAVGAGYEGHRPSGGSRRGGIRKHQPSGDEAVRSGYEFIIRRAMKPLGRECTEEIVISARVVNATRGISMRVRNAIEGK
ncbi:hypothetical protein FRC12_011372 [Ceratobasidium sp. 428]|nr:hypothetical protein FRC12_011372 [Ceratobasidium sp. 428]